MMALRRSRRFCILSRHMADATDPKKLVALDIAQVRGERAKTLDLTLPFTLHVQATPSGPVACLFQRATKFAVDEQMVVLAPHALFQVFTVVMAQFFGLQAGFQPQALPPGMGPQS